MEAIRRKRWPLAAAALSAALLAAPAAAALEVSFSEEAVLVAGLAPGAQVAWWSVAHEPREYHRRVVRRGGIEADADGDGTVALTGSGAAPLRSAFAVVELVSGEHALAAPEGFIPQAVEFPGGGLSGSAPGQLNRFVATREAMEIFYVRPGVGAYVLSVGDGGAGDRDEGENGALSALLGEAVALGESPPAPEHLQPGDVVFAIDPRSLDYFATRLAGGGPQD